MKFVSIRDFRGNAAGVLRDLPQEREMVITSNGRPVAILAAVGEDNVEESIAAFRRARAVEAVAALQRASASRGLDGIAPVEVEREIAEVRKARTR